VSRYIELDERGRGYCSFHEDQHQSFGVHRERNFWHCYAGCGGGSIIDFWQKWREKQGQDPSFKATLAELAKLLFAS
jgi:DNA primase